MLTTFAQGAGAESPCLALEGPVFWLCPTPRVNAVANGVSRLFQAMDGWELHSVPQTHADLALQPSLLMQPRLVSLPKLIVLNPKQPEVKILPDALAQNLGIVLKTLGGDTHKAVVSFVLLSWLHKFLDNVLRFDAEAAQNKPET
ncbi:hypothetical protein AK812_SmicGene1060 [Symbiodinium microadriaticum]|uniref:Uncharacterized protein n=1 Tax=Symbiodinium microadriaticum TaxID=2951 RepID=A0A1Q9F4Y2_SYMMI|nr:hypothetical protein AK812_SmicGene1060 [Symbiodinium microadriaticum]